MNSYRGGVRPNWSHLCGIKLDTGGSLLAICDCGETTVDLGGRLPSFCRSPRLINSNPARRELWYLAPFLLGNMGGGTPAAGNLQVVYGAKDWDSEASDDVGMARSSVQLN